MYKIGVVQSESVSYPVLGQGQRLYSGLIRNSTVVGFMLVVAKRDKSQTDYDFHNQCQPKIDPKPDAVFFAFLFRLAGHFIECICC